MVRFDKFLFANPSSFRIDYQINPYMDTSQQSDKPTVMRQWQQLVREFREYAECQTVNYQTFEQDAETLPDITFCANQAFPVSKNGFILSNMRHSQRKSEPRYFEKWAESFGYETHHIDSNANFEGTGDAKWHPNDQMVFVGFGQRTDEKSIQYISDITSRDVVKIQLINDEYYHLDTCFEPLSESEALVVPDAFDRIGLDKLYDKFSTIYEVPKNERTRLGANCTLVTENTVIINDNCPKTKTMLESNGYDVHSVPLGEFEKSGGSVDCLNLRIPNLPEDTR